MFHSQFLIVFNLIFIRLFLILSFQSAVPAALQRKFIFNFDHETCSVSHDDVARLFLTSKIVLQFFSLEIEKHNSSEDEQYFEHYIMKHMPNLLWCLSYCSGNGYMSNVSILYMYETLFFLKGNLVKFLNVLIFP